ncbi:amidohydrolase [Microbulbifer bruguierae]|uniref:Amidohydrolase n=1 Tax=Microbulbifer bruguierae TaxID=3029061 RepID=A0ABY8NBG6_9GAMM|nr:amidohydrolase [Microbulbifer bruguierae]WGL15137.1 amidohydrolase [Microbulbifer bruguierae]
MRYPQFFSHSVKLGIFLLLGNLLLACTESPGADRIYINGDILTVDALDTVTSALAVKGGKIIAVGTSEEITALADTHTETTDLQGKALLPGFIAVHEHPAISAVFRNFVDMSGFRHRTAAEAWQVLEGAIADTPKGEWIYAMGLDPVLLEGLQLPDRKALDQMAPHNPVFILAQSMHTAWVNSAALAAMDIDEETPDPGEGSYYGRDKNGRLNGTLVEKPALEPFLAKHKNPFKVTTAYAGVLTDLRNAGYTSVASLGFNMPPWLARWASMENLQPRIRQLFYYRGDNLSKLSGSPRDNDDFFRVRGAKFWYDGSPYSGSMVVEQAYLDSHLAEELGIAHGSHGEPVISAEALRTQIQELNECGWQIAIHVQGDRAAQEYLQILEQVYESLSETQQKEFITRRHRLEHGLLLSKEILPAFAKLGISPSFHINHIYYYGDALETDLLGAERTQRTLPVKSAFELGMHPTLHSDSPMFPAEPFSLMQTAISRHSRAGIRIGEAEALTPRQALRAMTINAAWQLGMEKEIGSLEVGKSADLVILDKNPLSTPVENWREIRVLETRLAGRR